MEAVHQGSTLIALPYVTKDGFSGGCVRSLLNLFASGAAGPLSFMGIEDKTQVHARNDACRAAIENNTEWLWFIDSDQDFPIDALQKLKACESDVACADMWSRSWPSYRLVFQAGERDEKGMVKHQSISDEVAERRGIEPMTYCGMGCTLIRTDILRRMKTMFPDQPWFWAADHGEDATFCFKVAEMGGALRCNFDLKSGHWGKCRMMGQMYTREKQ